MWRADITDGSALFPAATAICQQKNSVVSTPCQTSSRPRAGAPPLAHADAPRHTSTGNSAATRKPAPHHRAAGGRPLRALATISQQKTKRCKRQDAREQATASSLRAPFALRIHALSAAPLFTRSIMVCYSPMSSGPASRASVETRSVLCVCLVENPRNPLPPPSASNCTRIVTS